MLSKCEGYPSRAVMAQYTVIKSVPMDIDVEDPITKAMAAVQEQLCVAMEAQAWDQKC